MVLKIIATVLNVLVIIMAALSLMGGGVCFGIFGALAGIFNLVALWRGMEYDGGAFAVAGILGNVLVFINGIVAIFQAMSDKYAEVSGLLWAIALSFLSAGIVTMIATMRQDD